MSATMPTVAKLQALIVTLQTQVSALAAAAPAPAATTAVVFADTPQSLNSNDLIDYSTKKGESIYKEGSKALEDKALTEGFGMNPGQTVVFFEWVQEAGDRQTWMVNGAHHCVLQWANGRKTVPFNKSSNTPIFYIASSSCAYQAFAGTFEAMEASFFQKETVIQIPGHRLLREDAEVMPEEFIAEEDIHRGATRKKSIAVDEVDKEDDTVCTSNLPLPPEDIEEPDASIWRGPLTFDPLPPLDEDEDAPLAAANNQAELMRWHYRLGHLPFPKLKQLARNGEIPKKLVKLTAPKCAGCLFGTMTKLPWRGKESKSSHKVFVATKPGETVSVDQMTSTKVGFFAQ
jgi:hypothetical protein